MEGNKSVTTASMAGKVALPISWSNMNYKVGDREILRGLSGVALPSRTLAIMGSSGAGKTTFLNAISDRLEENERCVLSGERLLGDVPYEYRYRKLLAFVTQDDIVSSTATPQDALRFSLRIRRGTNPEVTSEKVDAMLDELNLTNCRDTIVGVPGVIAGLSGGERKRCNIGVELITDPKVLLLDEPTSGLDSVTAVKIVSTLSDLSRKGRTVIYTIHQPTAEVLKYFDDLMLMAMGKIVYHGTCADAVEYFESIGYHCPENHTPTDYFMTLLQDEDIAPKLIEHWEKNIEATTEKNAASPHISPMLKSEESNSETRQFMEEYCAKTGSSLGVQAQELFKRAAQSTIRDKPYLIMMTVQALFFAVIAALIFMNLTNDIEGVQDTQGLLFMVIINRCFSGVMSMVNTFPKEKAVYVREQQAASYSPILYFLAKSAAEFPVQAITCFLECLIIYLSVDLQLTAARFFIYYAVVFMTFQTGTGIGLAISAAVPTFEIASGLAPLVVVPMMLSGGLMASTERLHPYWWWLEKISFVRYGFVLVAHNEFSANEQYGCDVNKYGAEFCARQPRSGDAVLEQLGFDDSHNSVWAMWMSIGIMFMFSRICAVWALYRVARSKF